MKDLLIKKQNLAIAIVILLLQPCLVMADNNMTESNWYLSGSLGNGTLNSGDLVSAGVPFTLDLDNEVAGGITLGYHFTQQIATTYRAEVELWAFRPEINRYKGTAITTDSGSSVNITALMNNVFINFRNTRLLSPYVGAGIGIASVEIDAVNTNQSDDFVWSYQLLVGLDYKPEIVSDLSLSIGYRLFYMEDAKYYFGRLEDGEVHAASVGVRYTF